MDSSRVVVTSVVTVFCVLAASCSTSVSGDTTTPKIGTEVSTTMSSSTPSAVASSSGGRTTTGSTSQPTTQPTMRTALDTPGDLEAGTYLAQGMPVPVEITVPAGWFIDEGLWLRRPDKPAFIGFWSVFRVMDDACAATSSQQVTSAADFIEQLVAQDNTEATATPMNAIASGIPVTRVDVSTQVDLSTCASQHAALWSGPGGTSWISAAGETWSVYVFDLNGEVGVMSAGGGPHDAEATGQIEGMVTSLVIA